MVFLFQIYAQPPKKISEKALKKAEALLNRAQTEARLSMGDYFHPMDGAIDTIAECLQKYEKTPKVAGEIANWLDEIVIKHLPTPGHSSSTNDLRHTENELLYTAEVLSLEPVFNCISKYEKTPEIARMIAEQFWNVKNRTGGEKAVSDAALCISKYEKTPEVAVEIASLLESIAKGINRKAVSDAALCISKYEKTPEVAVQIAAWLGEIASDASNHHRVASDAAKWLSSEIVLNSISKYEKTPEVAVEIAALLGSIAENTKNEKAVSDTAAFLAGDSSLFDKNISELKGEDLARVNSTIENLGKTINYISNTIDDLYDMPKMRKKIANYLSPEMCYIAIGRGEEIFTSSFNLIFDRMAEALGNGDKEKGYKLILQKAKEYDPQGIFYAGFLMKISYFGAIDKIMPKDSKEFAVLTKEIIGMMETKEDASFLSVFFEHALDIPVYNKSVKDLLFAAAGDKKLNHTTRKACKIIIGFFKNKFEEYDISNLIKHPLSFVKYTPEIWMQKQEGEELPTLKIKEYFHLENENEEETGIPEHRNNFIRLLHSHDYKNDAGLSLEEALRSKEKMTYYSKDRGGKRIAFILEIADKNVDISGDCGDQTIDILCHRGHSYQVDSTFEKATDLETPKLIFLGSCGGFHVVPKFKEKLGEKALFVSTKNIGKGVVNDDILINTAEAIAYENKAEWGSIRSSVLSKLGAGKEEFPNYSFPDDLPQIMLGEL